MTVGGMILFPRAKPHLRREYSARATVSPFEGEMNLQPTGCAEKRPAIREGWLSESPRKRKYREAVKEMNMKHRMDLRSFLRISGMSLGISVVHQFAPMLAYQAEVEIADVFARKRDEGRIIRPAQGYFPLKAH